MIYPAWEQLLLPYTKNWGEFQSEKLDYVSCQEHADAIFESFEILQRRYDSREAVVAPVYQRIIDFVPVELDFSVA